MTSPNSAEFPVHNIDTPAPDVAMQTLYSANVALRHGKLRLLREPLSGSALPDTYDAPYGDASRLEFEAEFGQPADDHSGNLAFYGGSLADFNNGVITQVNRRYFYEPPDAKALIVPTGWLEASRLVAGETSLFKSTQTESSMKSYGKNTRFKDIDLRAFESRKAFDVTDYRVAVVHELGAKAINRKTVLPIVTIFRPSEFDMITDGILQPSVFATRFTRAIGLDLKQRVGLAAYPELPTPAKRSRRIW